jgi:regulator of cell morphogenesis and NO signaling
METRFNISDSIGDIVAKFPKASEVFKKYNIDFCCGGNRPLSEAVRKQGLREEEVLQSLEEAYEETSILREKGIDWRTARFSDLIDYIVNTHHAYLNRELPELGLMIGKVLRAHGAVHGEMLSKVHKLFNNLRMELEQHLIKEEEILFPLIKEYEDNPSPELLDKGVKVIGELEGEHEGAGDIIKELRRITGHFKAPEDACMTFILTYHKLEELESDLFQHIHLENNILFPRFENQRG